MGIFGWNYPPGCNSVPGDEPIICDICGFTDNYCVCPECKVCGDVGNPNCYVFGIEAQHHWQEKNNEQKLAMRLNQLLWERHNETDNILAMQMLCDDADEKINDAVKRGKGMFAVSIKLELLKNLRNSIGR